MSNVRIPKEEYKTLLTENAELKYLTAFQKSEIERLEKVAKGYEEEIDRLRECRFGE